MFGALIAERCDFNLYQTFFIIPENTDGARSQGKALFEMMGTRQDTCHTSGT
jgi:hypothetical protein